MKSLLAISIVGLVSTQVPPQEKRCLALAMSGGGTLGSYEAGALWGMYYATENKSQFEWDVVTGVSAGSINLAAVSVYPKGEEEAMVQDLSQRWSNLNQTNLFNAWKGLFWKPWSPLGIINGITSHSGAFNTQPLYDYLHNFLSEWNFDFKRKWVVSSVDVNTGAYIPYNEQCEDPVKAIMSSSAIPGVFPN